MLFQVLIACDPTVGNGSNRYVTQNVSFHYLLSLQVSAPCVHWSPENELGKLEVSLFT